LFDEDPKWYCSREAGSDVDVPEIDGFGYVGLQDWME
jgi:hypothetical protein